MSGMGSGRRNQSGKDTTNNCRALDVRHLKRDERLTPGNVFDWNWTCNGTTLFSIHLRTEAERVILDFRYENGGDWQLKEYPVSLEWTDDNLGGRITSGGVSAGVRVSLTRQAINPKECTGVPSND